jgi:hypothetical protein
MPPATCLYRQSVRLLFAPACSQGGEVVVPPGAPPMQLARAGRGRQPGASFMKGHCGHPLTSSGSNGA